MRCGLGIVDIFGGFAGWRLSGIFAQKRTGRKRPESVIQRSRGAAQKRTLFIFGANGS